jgi:uncharacterized membrane protein YcaP (DUF421 family)
MGGTYGGTDYNDTQYAKISESSTSLIGSLSDWTNTNNFARDRAGLNVVTYNSYIYVLGGSSLGGVNYEDVIYAKINTDGTIGTWIKTTNFTTSRISSFGSVAYNGYIYVMGGTNGSTYYNDVQYAPINTDGTIGTWKTTSSFTNIRSGLNAVSYNGYMYIMGGYNISNPHYYNDVQYAKIHPNGTLSKWNYTYNSASTTTFAGGFASYRAHFGAVAYNGYLYVMGGLAANNVHFNDVQYAPINTDGTIGTWKTTSSFTNIREGLGAVAYNGYLYVMGGDNYIGTSVFYNDVQYAPINPNGSVGTWSTTTNLNSPRSSFGTTINNGYLYVIGGTNGSIYYNDVQYAKIY